MTRAGGIRRQQPRRVFRDRREAGQVLAALLDAYRGKPDLIVLGLARGGVPVAWEVAHALGAPLDAFIVRKLGAPGHEEFAVGALASGGRVVVNDDVLRGLRVTPAQLREIAERERAEASQQQTQGLDQVTQALNQMEKVTQTTAATAEESAATSEELSGQAEQLQQSISFFNIGDDAPKVRSRHAAEPVRSERRAAPAPRLGAPTILKPAAVRGGGGSNFKPY